MKINTKLLKSAMVALKPLARLFGTPLGTVELVSDANGTLWAEARCRLLVARIRIGRADDARLVLPFDAFNAAVSAAAKAKAESVEVIAGTVSDATIRYGGVTALVPLITDATRHDWTILATDRDAKTLTLSSAWLREACTTASIAADANSPRAYGSCVYFGLGETHWDITATDGFRLANTHVSTTAGSLPEFCVPAMANQWLADRLQLIGDVTLTLSGDKTTLRVVADGIDAAIRLSAVKYPNWRGVIPNYHGANPHDADRKPRQHTANVDVNAMLQSISAVMPATDKSAAVRMELRHDQWWRFAACVNDKETATAIGSSNPDSPGLPDAWLPLTTAVNGRFLRDALTNIKNAVVAIQYTDAEDPICFTTPTRCAIGYTLWVIVPIKLNDAKDETKSA